MNLSEYFNVSPQNRPSKYDPEIQKSLEHISESEIIHLLEKGVENNNKEWDEVVELLSECTNLIPLIKKYVVSVKEDVLTDVSESMFSLLLYGTSYAEESPLLPILEETYTATNSKLIKGWILESLGVLWEIGGCEEAIEKLEEIADKDTDQEMRNHAQVVIEQVTSEGVTWI